MHALSLVIILLLVALAPAAAAAQEDAAALRREIEQLQKQLQSVTERLQRLEAQPQAPAQAPPAPSPGVAPPTAQQPAPQGISRSDVARPRHPFVYYEQRGAGQLLFDIGIACDFFGNLTRRNIEKAGGGSVPGLENRFFPREIERSLFGQIDPYASAVVRIEAGEETRGGDINVDLAEAYLTLLTPPFGTQPRIGQLAQR